MEMQDVLDVRDLAYIVYSLSLILNLLCSTIVDHF